MSRIITIFFLFPFFLKANCFLLNKDSIKTGKFKLAGFYLNGQSNALPLASLSDDEFGKLWPGYYNVSYVSFDKDKVSGFDVDGLLEAGISFYTRKNNGTINKKFQTQVGVSYFTQRSVGNSYHFKTFTHIDTLTSTIGDPTLYKDSITEYNNSLSYFTDYLGLNLRETYTTDPAKKINFVLGVGFKILYSLRPAISDFRSIRKYERISQDSTFAGDANYYSGNTNTTFSGIAFHNVPGSLLTQVDVSVGVNFRILTIKKNNSGFVLNPQASFGIDILKPGPLAPIVRGFAGFSLAIRYVFL